MASYQIFYRDQGHRLRTSPRHFFAGILMPVILAGALIGAVFTGRTEAYATVIHSMFILVGWHYVKQVFGCIAASQAFQKQYLQPLERKMLLGHLYSVWALNFFASQSGNRSLDYYGFTYTSLGLPPVLASVALGAVALSAVGVLVLSIRSYLDRGAKPAWAAVLILLSLYAWYVPAFHHPGFFYFVPFFHSLQYLVFVGIYRIARAGRPGSPERPQRVKELVIVPAAAILFGAITFYFIPKGLNAWNHSAGWWSIEKFGAEWAIAAATLFINIHHYFIDNVIWKSQVPETREFFFAPIRNSS